MHPAFSVIFLTTLLGAGQGLFLALYTAQLYAFFELMPVLDGRSFHVPGAMVALALLAAGLAASFFHLGHPERAWRSAAQWRTSWLSREVIALPAFMAVAALYGLAHQSGLTAPLFALPGGHQVDATLILGALGTLLAFGLFVCTAMIYACLRFLQEWHTPLTVINYTLLGSGSGFTLATALAGIAAPEAARFFAGWAAVLAALGLVFRCASLLRNARLKRKAAAMRAVKWIFLALTFALPLVLLALGVAGARPGLFVLAFAFQYAGLLAERWYFFAQANHPQNIYYQSVG